MKKINTLLLPVIKIAQARGWTLEKFKHLLHCVWISTPAGKADYEKFLAKEEAHRKWMNQIRL